MGFREPTFYVRNMGEEAGVVTQTAFNVATHEYYLHDFAVKDRRAVWDDLSGGGIGRFWWAVDTSSTAWAWTPSAWIIAGHNLRDMANPDQSTWFFGYADTYNGSNLNDDSIAWDDSLASSQWAPNSTDVIVHHLTHTAGKAAYVLSIINDDHATTDLETAEIWATQHITFPRAVAREVEVEWQLYNVPVEVEDDSASLAVSTVVLDVVRRGWRLTIHGVGNTAAAAANLRAVRQRRNPFWFVPPDDRYPPMLVRHRAPPIVTQDSPLQGLAPTYRIDFDLLEAGR